MVRLILAALLSVLISGCAMRRITELPELPRVPHDFNTLTRHFREVTVEGYPRPVVLSWVEAGEGPPMLLVHGLGTTAYSWRYVISSLAKHYRVIAVDLPGAGRSGAPTDLSQSPQSLAAVLDGFVQTLGLKKAYVVGNSMGGYVTLWWALAHPERFERLMILHSPGFPELRLYALHAILAADFSRPIFKFVTRNHEQFAHDNAHYFDESLKSREETREYARWTATPDRREVFRRVLREAMDPWTMRKLPEAIEASRAAKALVPIRLLWSRQDPLVPPEYGPRYQTLIPEAELVWLENTSHFMHVDTPEPTIKEILRFGDAR